MPQDHDDFITITKGKYGYFAILMTWTVDSADSEAGEGYWEPLETGLGRYATADEAVEEGVSWAAELNLAFADRGVI